MQLELLANNRKLLLALISILAGLIIDMFGDGISNGMLYLVLGIYFGFVVGNIGEHLAHMVGKKAPQSVEPTLSKILEYQESSIKALEYLVSYVKNGTKV